jgi:hypothetical protein
VVAPLAALMNHLTSWLPEPEEPPITPTRPEPMEPVEPGPWVPVVKAVR